MTDTNSLWEIVVRKQGNFNFTKNLDPDALFEITINSEKVTEKSVTVTLRKLIDMIEDIRTI